MVLWHSVIFTLVLLDHDVVDVGLGEYVQGGSTPTWLAAYRLLSKNTPGIPEVAIRMAHLSVETSSRPHQLLKSVSDLNER